MPLLRQPPVRGREGPEWKGHAAAAGVHLLRRPADARHHPAGAQDYRPVRRGGQDRVARGNPGRSLPAYLAEMARYPVRLDRTCGARGLMHVEGRRSRLFLVLRSTAGHTETGRPRDRALRRMRHGADRRSPGAVLVRNGHGLSVRTESSANRRGLDRNYHYSNS
jgi:hypothetical protein